MTGVPEITSTGYESVYNYTESLGHENSLIPSTHVGMGVICSISYYCPSILKDYCYYRIWNTEWVPLSHFQ